MFSYFINGTVFPERANVSISNIGFKIKGPALSADGLDIIVSIQASQISVVVKSETEINDYHTLKNSIQDLLGLILDIYGYLSGRGYDFEITTLTTPTNTPHIVFGVGIPILEATQNERPKNYAEIVQLFKEDGKFERQLRLALLNFRLAIRHPGDTAFHCYRAVEAMAQTFNKDWDEFNTKLGLDNKWIMEMKNAHADDQRHGISTFMSGVEREAMIKNTQETLDKFITFFSSLKK